MEFLLMLSSSACKSNYLHPIFGIRTFTEKCKYLKINGNVIVKVFLILLRRIEMAPLICIYVTDTGKK